jgi:hypothetical protein
MSELSRETDALLERGRDGESLAPHDRARLKRALLAQVAGVSVVATTSTAAAWTTTVAAKVVGAVVLVSSVGLGVATMLPARVQTPATQGASVITRVAPVPTKASPPPAAAAAATTATAPAITVAPAVEKPASGEDRATAPGPGMDSEGRARLPSASASSSLEEEARLLRAADDAMKAGDPDRALQLLGDLGRRFPDSSLAPERAAERVFALCMAGRVDDAHVAATDFLRAQDVGPLAARVRASCGGPSR